MSNRQKSKANEANSAPSSMTSGQRYRRERMVKFNNNKADEAGELNSWAHQASVPDENTPYNGRSRSSKPRPKSSQSRSKSFSRKGKSAQSPSDNKPTLPRDESLYDLSDMAIMIPTHRYSPVGVEHSGFVTLVEQSYKNIISVDSRISRQLTESTYLHVMVGYLWTRLFKLKQLFGEEIPFNADEVWTTVNASEALIPKEVHEYLKAIGQFSDGYGLSWRPYVPTICIPSVTGEESVAGCFGDGAIDRDNHNSYECFPAPYTTYARLEAEYNARANDTTFDPLPNMPENFVPTFNFLGYKRYLEPWHPQAKALMPVIYCDNYVSSRIKHCPPANNAVQSILASLQDRIKIETGVPSNIDGSLSQLCVIVRETGHALDILRLSDFTLRSPTKLTPSEMSMSSLFNYSRLRSEVCAGTAFITPDPPAQQAPAQQEEAAQPAVVARQPQQPVAPEARYPPGWLASRNDFHEFRGLYVCNEYADNDVYSADNFRQSAGTSHVVKLFNWIESKFRIKK